MARRPWLVPDKGPLLAMLNDANLPYEAKANFMRAWVRWVDRINEPLPSEDWREHAAMVAGTA